MTRPPAWSLVVPTIGRPSLEGLLTSLRATCAAAAAPGSAAPDSAAPDTDAPDSDHGPVLVVLCDDRPLDTPPLRIDPQPWPVQVLRTGGRGPAAARNAGWRTCRTPWVVFVDDDVLLPLDWHDGLLGDLRAAEARDGARRVGGVQARVRVPLPGDRRPTDWERSTAGLAGAWWVTADLAYRRAALAQVDGFDERFPRAYREDADLALRVQDAGWRLVRGERSVQHPVRKTRSGTSVRVQAGNQDDALMRALHGPAWRSRARAGQGRFAQHVATVAAFTTALVAAPAGRRRLATAAGALGAGLTAELLVARLRPGPRPGEPGARAEWQEMAWTSLVLPFAAVGHRVVATARHRWSAPPWRPAPSAVLFDRDGTLVEDVPFNGDPDRVRPVPGAREVLDGLRARGVRVGMVTNQSGVARGVLTAAQVDAVNQRVGELLGPFDTVQVCPHAPADACTCRKPGAGLVLAGAEELGLAPWQCALVGDIESDMQAAVAAGARAVLVPTAETRTAQVRRAELVATDLAGAVALLLGDHGAGGRRSADRAASPDAEPDGTLPDGSLPDSGDPGRGAAA